MKVILRYLSRVFVGITFVFSGFVKAVDPVGGAVKFSDYFTAFGFEWLSPLSLTLSIALAAFEFTLGFYLILNLNLRFISKLALATMSFFTVLTLGLAIFNPVTDCGCFGDAIILTNWQTFWKNMVIMVPTLLIYVWRKEYRTPKGIFFKVTASLAPLIYILFLAIHSYNHLPLLDFRPYKVGTNINAGISIPEGAETPEYETIFTLEKEGEKREFTVDEYPYDDSTWVFVDSETKVIKEGYQPPLHDFSILDENQNDVTSDLINHKGALFLLISPKVEKINPSIVLSLSELASKSEIENTPFYVVTSSSEEAIQKFTVEHKTFFNYLYADDVTLKTIIRSNPGLVLLYDGTIVGKWHYRDLPNKNIVDEPLANTLKDHYNKNSQALIWLHIFLLLFVTIAIINTRKTIKSTK